jgi:hypothetical protein
MTQKTGHQKESVDVGDGNSTLESGACGLLCVIWLRFTDISGRLVRRIMWVQAKFADRYKAMEGRGLNVRRYKIREYVISRQFRAEPKACFILHRVLVLHTCYCCRFIEFMWRTFSLSTNSISCTFVCCLKVSCRRRICNCWRTTIISCTVYRYVTICQYHIVPVSTSYRCLTEHKRRNSLHKYYPNRSCLFLCCLWLYTISGPTSQSRSHVTTRRVYHVIANSDYRKLEIMAFGCPAVAFCRWVSLFESWNLGHREQAISDVYVCQDLRSSGLLRGVGLFVTDVSGLRIGPFYKDQGVPEERRFQVHRGKSLISRVRLSFLWRKVGRLRRWLDSSVSW